MLLEVRNLRVAFRMEGELSVPVRGVSFDIPERGRIALVGESGCGKSLTALALGGLVDRAEISGEIVGARAARGPTPTGCAERAAEDVGPYRAGGWQSQGWPRIAYIFQNPMQSLNPVMRIGRQIEEAMPRESRRRESKSKSGMEERPFFDLDFKLRLPQLLSAVELPAETARKYPCELSGGQQQRAMIAMALAAEPELLIADEPTTALDVTTQKEVLDLIDRIADDRGMAVLLITHNLGLVAEHSRFVNVMYAGEIVESGTVAEVLGSPIHPYTQGLIAAVPNLDAPKDAPLRDIPGTVPPPTAWPSGCAFHPRCPKAVESCRNAVSTACGLARRDYR